MMATATELGLAGCPACGLVTPVQPVRHPRCPRCATRLRARDGETVGPTIALLFAAAICYVPANVLPVLYYSATGGVEGDTILDGVMSLQRSGSWVLALILLTASVMIPIGKIAVLAYLCVVVRLGIPTDLRECTRLFRIVEFIGRWSMLDVFVDAFVVALVQLPPFLSVRPGPGVPWFAATAILTMLAAIAFDPRLLWDAHERAGRHG